MRLMTQKPCPFTAAALVAPPLDLLPTADPSALKPALDAGMSVALIAGTCDNVCSEQSLRELHQKLSRTRLELLEGCDHFFGQDLAHAASLAAQAISEPRADL
ncbi:unnamed protein product [Effrenium voratum]|nr:unnamed protein product [Effrenium voratum]